MRIGLDTSVALRLITGEPNTQALVALREVERHLARQDELLISDLVISEIYFALQHHYGMNKSNALKTLRDFLRMSGMKASPEVVEILSLSALAASQPGFVDRLIHAEYLRADARMITFERAARKLPGVRVLAG